MPIGSIIAGLAGPVLGSIFGGTSGSAPPNVNTSGTQATQLPPWYTSYLQGALGTGQQLASQPYPQYTGQRLANFNDTQNTAFNAINQNQGNWAPTLQSGITAAQGVVPGAQQAAGTANMYGGQGAGSAYGQAGLSNQYASLAPQIAGQAAGLGNQYGSGAVTAASRPIQQWTDPGVSGSWMSPYMKNVTDAIAQQGNQNWNTNLMPGIESQFIASGNPNSASNAAALGVGAAQTQANITAAQSQALQQGYQNAMQGMQAGQGQQLQQSGLAASTGLGAGNLAGTLGNLGTQAGLGAAGAATSAGNLGVAGSGLGANTALSGGNLNTTAGLGSASNLGSLASQLSSLGYTDIANLLSGGNQQQGLEQKGYDTAYGNFQQQVQYPWQQLSNLSGIASGAQLPTSTSATGQAPLAGATYGPSGLQIGTAASSALGGGQGILNMLGYGSNNNGSASVNTAYDPTGASLSSTNSDLVNNAIGGVTGTGSTVSNPGPGFARGGLARVSNKMLPIHRKRGGLAACSGGAYRG